MRRLRKCGTHQQSSRGCSGKRAASSRYAYKGASEEGEEAHHEIYRPRARTRRTLRYLTLWKANVTHPSLLLSETRHAMDAFISTPTSSIHPRVPASKVSSVSALRGALTPSQAANIPVAPQPPAADESTGKPATQD